MNYIFATKGVCSPMFYGYKSIDYLKLFDKKCFIKATILSKYVSKLLRVPIIEYC